MSFIVKRKTVSKRISVPSSLIGSAIWTLVAVQAGLSIGLAFSVQCAGWILGLFGEPYPDLNEVVTAVYACALAFNFVLVGFIGWMLLGSTGATERSILAHLKLVFGSRTAWWFASWWASGSMTLMVVAGYERYGGFSVGALVATPVLSLITFWPALTGLVRIWRLNRREPYFAGLSAKECLRLQPATFSHRPNALARLDAVADHDEANRYARLARSMGRNRSYASAFILLIATAGFGLGLTRALEPALAAVPLLSTTLTLLMIGHWMRDRADAFGRSADEFDRLAEDLRASTEAPQNRGRVWARSLTGTLADWASGFAR
ncbi:hypothetical protein [uncultured Plantibacter sp.]|uniref:hypothetical protein n=1 Tax=uncultured Plantibacter sp. TaxID=293337 RepID=UPI0028CFE1A5|nr:hypothetical protein [uncultured Plantibacter sp.]